MDRKEQKLKIKMGTICAAAIITIVAVFLYADRFAPMYNNNVFIPFIIAGIVLDGILFPDRHFIYSEILARKVILKYI